LKPVRLVCRVFLLEVWEVGARFCFSFIKMKIAGCIPEEAVEVEEAVEAVIRRMLADLREGSPQAVADLLATFF
jgi:hypothetical protein